ncbi:MAG: glucuronate isomerase [Spirochaetaceae bacterium]|jgi:glucuronate isomerase|nr:glucuronate isomerase [Spirochaetaceae bacterium]
MKFMDKDFLLTNKTAQKLYHEAASEEPIFDYHCHLIPKEIADNRRFPDLAYMWLAGDHYKWRAMRANGIAEQLITGDAEPYDKFLAWAETMPRLLGNPLYHWTHLELQRYFGIDEALNQASAPAIWKTAQEKLQKDESLSVYGIFKRFKVYAVGTTDDPADSLEYHEKIAGQKEKTPKILPSFRPDKALNIDKPEFPNYIVQLGKAAGQNINNLEDLGTLLKARLDLFDRRGCRAADHGLVTIPFENRTEEEVNLIFVKALSGEAPKSLEAEAYKTFLLRFLAEEYCRRGWVMQIHLAAIRNVNRRMLKSIGPDTGYDGVHDLDIAGPLAAFFDSLESQDALPKTILYSLNPKDYYPLSTIMGGFQGGFPGKMQLGSAWWFLDHRDGMEEQMRILGNSGLLSRFVGMLTDSRSFLSYPRHEYFRRILCNLLGVWAEAGEIPQDFALLSGMVRDISFRNAERYFK